MIKRKSNLSDRGMVENLMMIMIGLLVIGFFVLVWGSIDTGIITDKLIEGDVVKSYYFEIDNEVYVTVSQTDYEIYQIGDEYTFSNDEIVGGIIE